MVMPSNQHIVIVPVQCSIAPAECLLGKAVLAQQPIDAVQ